MTSTAFPQASKFSIESLKPAAFAALRIMTGLLFLEHGTSKLLGFPHEPKLDGLQLFSLMGFAGVLELGGGFLIVVGLFTRPVAFVLSGMMAAAYFIGHGSKGFFPALNGGDAAILFCFIFLYLVAAGAGPYSLDARRR
ncbi:MAG: DoxX family protein [Hyphomicrobiales bacterium]|jgi:putative oxidoreductase|nr:DoxX family protein [Hyphomicrobiales bacterium]